jgi:hypothetical protein
MNDPSFDLSKFDPSTLDLSHLHQGERDRIKNRQFDSRELSLLLSGQNPWTKSGKPQPLPSTPRPLKEPKAEETDSAEDRKGWEHLLNTPEAREIAEDLEQQRRSLKAIFGPRNETPPIRAYQTPMDMLRAASIEGARERARQEVGKEYQAERENLTAQLLEQNDSPGHAERLVAGTSRLPREPPDDLSVGPPEPPQNLLWDKFWKLGESNVFMGGGIGVALAALAFLMAGAPRFAVFLLCLAWLLISLSIYKHRFFEDKSLRIQILGNVLACSAVAVGFVAAWVLLAPSLQQTLTPIKTESTISNPQSQPSASVADNSSTTDKPKPEENEVEDNVFLSEKYPAFGKSKTFTFFGDENYGAVSFQARFGMGSNVTIIVLVHSTDADPRYAAGDCLTAINNYQAIVDDLKADVKKGRDEFIDLNVHPTLICHYDYATDIPPAKSEALKRIASLKHLILNIEGPRGPK